MAKTWEWKIAPMERGMLVRWLAAYTGHSVMIDTALDSPTLRSCGITWDGARRRFKLDTQSAEVPVHPRAYFVEELRKAQGRGELVGGDWSAVWMIDVASALLSLISGEADPTVGVKSRAERYELILSWLKPPGSVTDASTLAGEIRG